MLIQPTLDSLNRLKLHGMAAALSEQLTQSAAHGLAFEERFGLLVEREVVHRENRRLTRLLQVATLKERGLPRGPRLSRSARPGSQPNRQPRQWRLDPRRPESRHSRRHRLRQDLSRLRLGPSSLSSGPLRTLSARTAVVRVFEELGLCHADGSFRKRLAAIAKVDLVLIDDFAISPIGPRERNDLLELLDDRVGGRSTLVTSQLPPDHWHDYIGDPTLADAILDRLLHNAHKIHLEGKESKRKRDPAVDAKPVAKPKKID